MADNNKKLIEAEVVNKSGANCVKVRIERTRASKLYGKRYKVHKNILADYGKESLDIGDKVLIEQTRPLSKRKSFKINKVIK